MRLLGRAHWVTPSRHIWYVVPYVSGVVWLSIARDERSWDRWGGLERRGRGGLTCEPHGTVRFFVVLLIVFLLCSPCPFPLPHLPTNPVKAGMEQLGGPQNIGGDADFYDEAALVLLLQHHLTLLRLRRRRRGRRGPARRRGSVPGRMPNTKRNFAL